MATHMKRRHSVDAAAAAPAPLTSLKQTTAVAKVVRKVSQGILAQTLLWQLTLPAHRQ